jgi:hypothetical protein
MATATKRAVAMVTRVADEDDGNGKSSKINGDGNEEGNCKEEGEGKQGQQQDDGNRDNDDDHNDNGKEYNNGAKEADNDDKDNGKDGNYDGAAALASGGWWRWGRATNATAGVECSYFFIETGFWVLVVGKGPIDWHK